MRLILGLVAGAAMVGALSVLPAKADTIDLFGVGNGTFSWTKGSGNVFTITGNSGSLTSIPDLGTSVSLSFTGSYSALSGPCITNCTGPNPTFGSGASLIITDVSGLTGISTSDGTPLVTDTSTGSSVSFLGTHGTFTGFFSGTIDPMLIAYFCPTCATTGTGAGVQDLFKVALVGSTYRGNLASTDIEFTPVSEPATLALLGGGLLFAASKLRKRVSARLAQRRE